jgi:hypothetical protein
MLCAQHALNNLLRTPPLRTLSPCDIQLIIYPRRGTLCCPHFTHCRAKNMNNGFRIVLRSRSLHDRPRSR